MAEERGKRAVTDARGGDAGRGGCSTCSGAGRTALPRRIAMAFQPIVDLAEGSIFAQEALVRGAGGESAGSIVALVNEQNQHTFDQRCRVTVIETVARLGVPGRISINFMPNAVYEPENCLKTTVRAARKAGIPLDRLIFEVTEGERVADVGHLRHIMAEYRRFGLSTAIDDFGAGFAGLSLLADLQPDLLKIDLALVRGIDRDRVRRSIVVGIRGTAAELGIGVIAEGIETVEERDALLDLGITLQQGFLFARPAFDAWVGPDALDGLPGRSVPS